MTAISYKQAGVDISETNSVKEKMRDALESSDARVLNRLGAFASLFRLDFPTIDDPVLVLKMEEPGSKQLLALARGRYREIARDTIHHLINDLMVMGAVPLAILDAIVCGTLQPAVVNALVAEMAAACREQGCSLVGGETSIQPGVLAEGRYVITAAACGVVSERRVIDGSRIVPGDAVIAVASNGFHTNGYSLLRQLLAAHPDAEMTLVGGEPFIERALRPHLCYAQGLRGLFELSGVHGLAHITGGGIKDNLARILPSSTTAIIDLQSVRVLDVFKFVRQVGSIPDDEMLQVFNLGVGLISVVASEMQERTIEVLQAAGYAAYVVGTVRSGNGSVVLQGALDWS